MRTHNTATFLLPWGAPSEVKTAVPTTSNLRLLDFPNCRGLGNLWGALAVRWPEDEQGHTARCHTDLELGPRPRTPEALLPTTTSSLKLNFFQLRIRAPLLPLLPPVLLFVFLRVLFGATARGPTACPQPVLFGDERCSGPATRSSEGPHRPSGALFTHTQNNNTKCPGIIFVPYFRQPLC